MSLFVWKSEYSVNEPTLDSHHQKLFGMLNSLYACVMDNKEADCVVPVIDELSEFTQYHFAAEEVYMKENGYDGFDAHILEHRAFTRTVDELRTKYLGNERDVTKELIIVIGDWLLQHVLKQDRKYAEAINNNVK